MSGGFFDADTKRRQLDDLQKQIAEPNFWSDQDRSSKLLQQRARLEQSLEVYRQVIQRMEDVQALMELAREGEPVLDDLASQLSDMQKFIDGLETKVLLSGENDRNNAIVNIHPGAGGTEAQDWAEMLMRM